MESKNITLVIGSYNPSLQWFKNALKSARGLFSEIVVVNDGSQSFPYEILQSNDTCIDHESNQGFWHARNTGCAAVRTEWIASLDDDDEFIRENVKELNEILSTTDADVIHFPIELFGEQSGNWAKNPDMSKILESNQIPSGSWFRKNIWEKLEGFQLAEGEDWDFWARARKHGFKFLYFPKPIYRHRMRKGSMSSGWVGDKFIEIRNNVRKNYEKESI